MTSEHGYMSEYNAWDAWLGGLLLSEITYEFSGCHFFNNILRRDILYRLVKLLKPETTELLKFLVY